MKTIKEALEGLLWLIDQGQLIEKEPSICAPLLVNDAMVALIESNNYDNQEKADLLKQFWNRAVEEHLDCSDVDDLIDRMVNELKEDK
jgi:hypothetical protein